MSEYYILQQMKAVHDAWLPFKETVDSVFMSGITEGVLLSLDKAQWDKGVDPMFAKITSVLDSYKSGQGTCTQFLEKDISFALASVPQLPGGGLACATMVSSSH